MKIEDFKSGHYQKGYKYSYFVPAKINSNWIWDDPTLSVLLERVSLKVGELNTMAHIVPDMDMFIQMHVTKEAVISSRIEGTRTNMDEALFAEDEITPENRNDWHEVRNYTKALNESIEMMKKLPLSTPLLKESHRILMDNVRGKNKQPGEFRESQNWIGGATISDAVFIPPSHEFISELMSDLEKFIHNEDIHVPLLIKIAIAHYQFETIHPFLDGNGRIGRLMITQFLVEKKLLDKPLLYLSSFFESDKNLYYDNLTRVRTHNELLRWVKYFLIGVEQVSEKSINTLKKIIGLKDKMDEDIHKWKRRSRNAYHLMKRLFQNPVVRISDVQKEIGVSKKSAGELVNILEKNGYLEEVTGNSRYKIYLFRPYVDLFEN